MFLYLGPGIPLMQQRHTRTLAQDRSAGCRPSHDSVCCSLSEGNYAGMRRMPSFQEREREKTEIEREREKERKKERKKKKGNRETEKEIKNEKERV